MDLTITAKIQIYPNNKQIEVLNNTMIQINKALNYISDYVFNNNCLNQKIIQKDIYYYLRDTYNLKSQMACSAIKTVIAKYKTCKSLNHDFALVNFKNLEYDLVYNRDYSIVAGIFSINSLEGRLI
jgi:putative transposase